VLLGFSADEQTHRLITKLPIDYQFRLGLIETVLMCNSVDSVSAAMAVANMVRKIGISYQNVMLVLKLLETNNPYVVDALFGTELPELSMRNITPKAEFLEDTFKILIRHNPGSLYPKVLLSLLSIIDIAYKASKDGMDIYTFTMSELYNIGKYLDEEKDQFDKINSKILDILDNLYAMGINQPDWKRHFLAFMAMQIRMAYFDKKKRLVDILPQELLVRLEPEPPIQPDPSIFSKTP
jgi:hypothetical protein